MVVQTDNTDEHRGILFPHVPFSVFRKPGNGFHAQVAWKRVLCNS